MQTRKFCLLALTSLACSVVATAQVSQTAGAVRGVVRAKKAGPVAGASVTLLNKETGWVRTAVTDANGAYLFSFAPVGPYEITVTAPKLRTAKNTGIRVSLGETTAQNFDMDTAEATAVVEVIAEAAGVDTTSVTTNATMDEQQIDSVPLVSRNFTDVVQLTPGAPPNAQGYRDAIQGARGIMNNFMMDGTSYNSKFNGEQRGGTRIPFAFGLESVKEIQVITNPFDVQYGDATGGIVNAITKGGTNEFTGMLLDQIRPSSLVARMKTVPYDPTGATNTIQARTTNFSQNEMAFNVGGPIIKDKLFYFVNVDYVHFSQDSTPAWGQTGDPSKDASTAWPIFSGPGGFGNSIVASNKGLTILQEAATPWTNDEKHMTAMARIDWNINADQRATFRVNFQNYKGQNDIWAGTVKSNEAESNNSSIKYQTLSWVAELNSTVGTSFLNQVLLQASNERRPERPNSTVSPEVDLPGFYTGNYYIDPRDTDESTIQLIDNASYIHGDWTFKAGIDWQKINYRNTFFQYGHGAWSFKSFSAANNWISGAIPSNTSVIQYQQTWSSTNGFIQFGEKQLANYVGVTYNGLLDHRLTLNAGVRYTREMWDDNPDPNPRVQGLDQMPDNGAWDPRFGFALDLFGDNRTVIRGGVGLFSIANPAQNVATTFLQNGQNTLPYKVSYNAQTASLFNAGGALSYSNLIRNNGTLAILDPNSLASIMPAGSIQLTLMDPNARMSQSRNWQLGIDHALQNGLVLRAQAVYKVFMHLQYFMDINMGQVNPATGTTDASVYYNDGYPFANNVFTDAAASTTPRPGHAVVRGRNLDLAGYGSVGLSKWDGQGYYKAFIIEAEQHTANGFGFRANATFSKSYDSNSNERGTAQSASSNPMDPSQPLAMAPSDNNVPFRANLLLTAPTFYGIRSSVRFTYSEGYPFTPKYYADVNGDSFFNDPALGGRNSMRQPYYKQLDLQLGRSWKLPRHIKLDTNIQVFNPFNWANQTTGNTTVDAAADKNGVLPFTLVGTPDSHTRQVQGTVKLTF